MQTLSGKSMEYKIPVHRQATERNQTVSLGGYLVQRRGRFWAVLDSAESLVCLTVYKRGALEVVRRLVMAQ